MPSVAACLEGVMEVAARRPERASVLVMLSDDLFIGRRLRQLAHDQGMTVADATDGWPGLGAPPPAGPEDGGAVGQQPAVAVIDLHLPGALDRVHAWRAHWPDALVVGYLGIPDRELWVAAQRSGCDLVTNRGALLSRLRDRLAHRTDQRERRFPLFEIADAAGRLGLVFRADDTPVGPLAVYQVAGRLYAIADLCPHAGAPLSSGEVESAVVSCPRHGSRFDIRTGERLRGPADADVACYRLAQQEGQVFLLLGELGNQR
ncbi:MAG TPA: Rieske 2Fe-2S domain-containing protein [Streptosporangiaceae bacterium]